MNSFVVLYSQLSLLGIAVHINYIRHNPSIRAIRQPQSQFASHDLPRDPSFYLSPSGNGFFWASARQGAELVPAMVRRWCHWQPPPQSPAPSLLGSSSWHKASEVRTFRDSSLGNTGETSTSPSTCILIFLQIASSALLVVAWPPPVFWFSPLVSGIRRLLACLHNVLDTTDSNKKHRPTPRYLVS